MGNRNKPTAAVRHAVFARDDAHAARHPAPNIHNPRQTRNENTGRLLPDLRILRLHFVPHFHIYVIFSTSWRMRANQIFTLIHNCQIRMQNCLP